MKKTTAPIETPLAKVKVEPTPAPKAVAEAAAKKSSTATLPDKQPEISVPVSKTEPAAPAVAADAVVKKSPRKTAAPAKTKTPTVKARKPAAPKPEAEKPDMPMFERVGLAAGSVWHYLSGNGETAVAKLIKELPEEEKVVQRAMGWLAREDKISIAIVDRVELVSLKE
ncbi:winged helix-turn-helix domain-containing protein [Methylomonas sp. SURF-2]|uniref:Winged helix-turn-helix domain-containing protein n=1 Tax=Methylomonas subterranea TaxID=2952225 RepID=A0ABT1TJL2_9GAMM|nr:winged helix-turn-helix domain-containing protein [Methylomonas sp. SURF-2]MCQ8105655.1 winged helix-turn-helix domain-containing protein [Methylomonas sp. SURF-2]